MPDIRTLVTTSIAGAVAGSRRARSRFAPLSGCVKGGEVASTGDGKPPRVHARTWGNCNGLSGTVPPGPGSPTPPELKDL